jgi:hypothetical protein
MNEGGGHSSEGTKFTPGVNFTPPLCEIMLFKTDSFFYRKARETRVIGHFNVGQAAPHEVPILRVHGPSVEPRISECTNVEKNSGPDGVV